MLTAPESAGAVQSAECPALPRPSTGKAPAEEKLLSRIGSCTSGKQVHHLSNGRTT